MFSRRHYSNEYLKHTDFDVRYSLVDKMPAQSIDKTDLITLL
jgi:hypothetical protein